VVKGTVLAFFIGFDGMRITQIFTNNQTWIDERLRLDGDYFESATSR
jgi:hypothetical protein